VHQWDHAHLTYATLHEQLSLSRVTLVEGIVMFCNYWAVLCCLYNIIHYNTLHSIVHTHVRVQLSRNNCEWRTSATLGCHYQHIFRVYIYLCGTYFASQESAWTHLPSAGSQICTAICSTTMVNVWPMTQALAMLKQHLSASSSLCASRAHEPHNSVKLITEQTVHFVLVMHILYRYSLIVFNVMI
jgi:hypothetical protein